MYKKSKNTIKNRSNAVFPKQKVQYGGPSGIRTRVLGFEGRQDIHYPKGPASDLKQKDYFTLPPKGSDRTSL